jgi:DNA-binding NarL/FixJ family response regulator
LVEDNPGDVLLLRRTLGDCAAGEYALAVAETCGQAQALLARQPFDAVLLDLSLPDVQGLEVIGRLSPVAAGAPIVVLTGLADEETAQGAVRRGAAAYLVKGRADAGTIGRVIRAAIRQRRGDGPPPAPHQAAAAVAQRPEAAENAPPPAAAETFDLDRALVILGGHYDLFQEMTGYFFRDAPKLMDDLQAGLRNGDARMVAQVAHRLKGTVLYLAAQRAADSAARLEEIGLSRDLTSAAEVVEHFQQEIARLSEALAPHRPGISDSPAPTGTPAG